MTEDEELERRIIAAMLLSSCFACDRDGYPLVCASPPCVCAKSLIDVIKSARLIAAADLLAALKAVVSDILGYEKVNNIAPNPGRKYCWDSVARAHDIIAKAEGPTA